MSLINYRLKVTLNDGRSLIGQMLAFDKHMNLVLSECEEFRKIKSRKSKAAADGTSAVPAPAQEQKRTLGLVILRGETVVSIAIEGPPPKVADDAPTLPLGPGQGLAAGRGMGLGGGIPPPSLAARPMPYARPPPGFPGMPGMPGLPPPGFPGAPPPGFARPPAGFPGAPPPGFPPQGFPPQMRPPQ
ncbi:U1 snRNP component [Phaffia rhodozyma]|uniref:Sm protein B n=1 Tax=Phaffia rhodozyma TaxID=264483 RepID=A0A0F7SMQ1_PHARH|nr:U1 snRNP component [Phaffia rhodozyma]